MAGVDDVVVYMQTAVKYSSLYNTAFGRAPLAVSIKLEDVPSHIPYIFSINGV